MPNVQEQATPLAGGSVGTGVEIHVTGDVADNAASGGYGASSCSPVVFVPLNGVANLVDQAIEVVDKWRELKQPEPLLVSADGVGTMLRKEIESRGIRVERVTVDRRCLNELSLFVGQSYAMIHSHYLADLVSGFSVDNGISNVKSSERRCGLYSKLIGMGIKASSSIKRVVKLMNFKYVGSYCVHSGMWKKFLAIGLYS